MTHLAVVVRPNEWDSERTRPLDGGFGRFERITDARGLPALQVTAVVRARHNSNP